MYSAIIQDEVNPAGDLITENSKDSFDKVIIFQNGCIIGDYIYSVFQSISDKYRPAKIVFIRKDRNGENLIYHGQSDDFYGEDSADMGQELKNNVTEKTICYYILDCTDKRFAIDNEHSVLLKKLNLFCNAVSEKKAKAIFCIRIPQIENCPDHIKGLAEHEYDAYLRNKTQKTKEELFYLKAEEVIRDYSINKSLRAILIRVDNIIGPECQGLVQGLGLDELLRDVAKDNTIRVSEHDHEHFYSLLSIGDLLTALIQASINEKIKVGNIYNISGVICSRMELKLSFYSQFADTMKLICSPICQNKRRYHILNSLKISKSGWKNKELLGEICYRQGCYFFGYEYNMERLLDVYSGRLKLIIQKEKEILGTIDKICRENDIQYFLAGGSTLGAVRHQDVIPWDDDIDIGMLRPDYEKFKEICPKLLPDNMVYEAANGNGQSHYHFDKIRIKDTYFSTNYSSNFQINDGIFLDVLVYDNTSNIHLFQSLHIHMVSLFSRLILFKWKNRPNKKKYHRTSVLVLFVLRMIGWNWLHNRFDHAARKYEKHRKSRYVIDSMGQNIKKGAMKKEWLKDIELVPFGDAVRPVPKGYHEYLSHLYGANYMQLLPINKRLSGHKIARIDLGNYLYTDEPETRHMDPRGELYERTGDTNS